LIRLVWDLLTRGEKQEARSEKQEARSKRQDSKLRYLPAVDRFDIRHLDFEIEVGREWGHSRGRVDLLTRGEKQEARNKKQETRLETSIPACRRQVKYSMFDIRHLDFEIEVGREWGHSRGQRNTEQITLA
jgi:hypothetical protein